MFNPSCSKCGQDHFLLTDVLNVLMLHSCTAVITGGLDSKLVVWDFSKGRPKKIVDFGMSLPLCSSCLLTSFSIIYQSCE